MASFPIFEFFFEDVKMASFRIFKESFFNGFLVENYVMG
jgi:hypothetical protein